MPTIFLAAPFSLLAADSLAHAKDDEGCTRAPNEQWMSIEQLKTKLTEKGLADSKVEIEDGCAEADALEGVPMGTTLRHSIIYKTADARSVGHEMPSLEMLMHMSFFSIRVFSPSLFGYETAWQKEADELSRAAEEAERLDRKDEL